MYFGKDMNKDTSTALIINFELFKGEKKCDLFKGLMLLFPTFKEGHIILHSYFHSIKTGRFLFIASLLVMRCYSALN